MKELLVILLATLSSSFFTPCKGQFNTYHPFPDSNAAWRETTWESYNCGIQNTDVLTEFDYYVRGDTVVNGKTYIKVNSSGGYQYQDGDCPPFDTVWQCYNSLLCLLREDTLAKKVYASFSPNYGTDTVLYDFTLQVGDTLPNTYINDTASGNYVYAIDSILVGTTYRKQFIIAVDTGIYFVKFDSVIEGIGSSQGLLTDMFPYFEGGTGLDCFVDSTFNFSYFSGAPCNIFYTCPVPSDVLPVEKPVESVSVIPNPSGGKFIMQIGNVKLTIRNENIQIQIYNVLGEQIYNSPFTIHHSPLTIDLSSQPSSIYLYRVIWENGELAGEGKVIIQK